MIQRKLIGKGESKNGKNVIDCSCSEQPKGEWPGAADKPQGLEMLTWKRNSNTYAVNQTVRKDICGGALRVGGPKPCFTNDPLKMFFSTQNVNLRVEVLDEDFFGKYDLIEQFECKFVPHIVQDPRVDGTEWTLLDNCRGRHQNEKIKCEQFVSLHHPVTRFLLFRLTYRWRVYEISPAECGKKSAAKPLLTMTVTARPPMNAGEP